MYVCGYFFLHVHCTCMVSLYCFHVTLEGIVRVKFILATVGNVVVYMKHNVHDDLFDNYVIQFKTPEASS